MAFSNRLPLYNNIETNRSSKVITFITSDRINCETQIASDCIDPFVSVLNKIGPTQKISLILHTNGGHTSTAWRIVNLVQSFCDELEVIIPLKAMSSGTLISLGADKLIMTKQAALGSIDPSLVHALSPTVPSTMGVSRVPVSVEAVKGYIDFACNELSIKDDSALASIYIDLSTKIHPLVLGEIFRSREQIRFLADKLIRRQVQDGEKIQSIIDFLCSESGSHDYTINRREALKLGLKVEKPCHDLYQIIQQVHDDYTSEMCLLQPYSPQVTLGKNSTAPYTLVRSLIESPTGGCYAFVTEGTLTAAKLNQDGTVSAPMQDARSFDGWKKVA